MNNNLSFYLNELPVDMLEEIFSYLPEKTHKDIYKHGSTTYKMPLYHVARRKTINNLKNSPPFRMPNVPYRPESFIISPYTGLRHPLRYENVRNVPPPIMGDRYVYPGGTEYWKKVKSDFYPRNVNDEMYGGGFDIWQKEQKNIWGRGKYPAYIHSMYRFTRKTRKPVRKTRKTKK